MPFAQKERVSDATICDYWGWRTESYQALSEKGVSDEDNVSAILIHAEKGREVFGEIEEKIIAEKVEPESIIRHNPQLVHPFPCAEEERRKIVDGYTKDGYDAVEQYFKTNNGLKRYFLRLNCMIPQSVKKWIKRYVLHI